MSTKGVKINRAPHQRGLKLPNIWRGSRNFFTGGKTDVRMIEMDNSSEKYPHFTHLLVNPAVRVVQNSPAGRLEAKFRVLTEPLRRFMQ